jgi:hypothetical protein
MAICDAVRESKTETGVFHLKSLRQGITATILPFVPRRLCLFFFLSGPRPGEYPCYVWIVNDRTHRVVFYAHVEPRPTFDAADEIMRQLAEFSKDITYFGGAVQGTQTKEDEARNSQLEHSIAGVFKATEEAIDAPIAKLRVAELFLALFRTVAEQKEPLRSFVAIDKNLRILMGDNYFGHLPETMEEHL